MNASRAGSWAAPALAVLLGILAVVGGAAAQVDPAAGAGPSGIQVRVILRPPTVELGERTTYRVQVVGDAAADVQWLEPDSVAHLTWGAARSGRTIGKRTGNERDGGATNAIGEPPDTVWVEIPLQAFTLGAVEVPGLGWTYVDARKERRGVRAPATRLIVVPVLTAADSQASLHGLRGPLAAPWWERVPWLLVAAGLLALAAVILLVRRARRRRPAPVVAAPIPELGALETALAAFAALRALGLPGQGRFAEHAFRLGQILRRFLESRFGVAHPGDTTPELLRHLDGAALDPQDLQRLAGLLRTWDRIKFAREPATLEEADRMEAAVDGLVRRVGAPAPANPERRVA